MKNRAGGNQYTNRETNVAGTSHPSPVEPAVDLLRQAQVQAVIPPAETAVDRAAKMEVAQSVSSPHRTLELLARDPNSAIRAQVAANSVCSPAVVGLLSSDRDIWVRQAALRNLSCPAAILDGMSGGSQRDRWNVARNPVCPPHVLERLSLDPDRLVRRGVATNVSCPDTTLGRLLSDPDPDIRCEALVNRHSRQHTSPAREADG